MKEERPAWMDTEVEVHKSMADIRKMMQKYGANNWSFPETLEGDLKIYFTLHGQPIMLDLKTAQMVNRLRKVCPRTWDNAKIRHQAQRIVARQAFYYLKAVFEVVETGLFSPLDVLMAQMVLPDGQRVSDKVLSLYPDTRKLLGE